MNQQHYEEREHYGAQLADQLAKLIDFQVRIALSNVALKLVDDYPAMSRAIQKVLDEMRADDAQAKRGAT